MDWNIDKEADHAHYQRKFGFIELPCLQSSTQMISNLQYGMRLESSGINFKEVEVIEKNLNTTNLQTVP